MRGIINWTARERSLHGHSQRWFLTVGAIATLLVIAGILFQSYFFIAFVVLAFGVIMLYARREPHEIVFAITEEGIITGHTLLAFSSLKSFWIFQRRDGPHELSLETQKIFLPTIIVPIEHIKNEDVQKTLLRFLPEKEHIESAAEQIMRNLGF